MFFGCEEHKATLANLDNKGRLWEGFQSLHEIQREVSEGSKRQEVGSLQGIKEFINLFSRICPKCGRNQMAFQLSVSSFQMVIMVELQNVIR